ncbi:Uncharacterised protein [Yersinia mollaretii]|nr:Uncharacterised protein [Yersinia mollaretii]CQQ20772.1 Uncharacterised protein [Yersinia mollaretii]
MFFIGIFDLFPMPVKFEFCNLCIAATFKPN